MPSATTSRRTGCITNRGLMYKGWFTKIFGTQFQRELKRIRPIVDAIHRHEARLKGLNRVHDGADAFQLTLELGAEDLGEPTLVHQSSIRDTARAPRCSRGRHPAPDSGWSGPVAPAPGSWWPTPPPPAPRRPAGWPGVAAATLPVARTLPRPPARGAPRPDTRRPARRPHRPPAIT